MTLSAGGQPGPAEVIAALPVAALLVDPHDRVRNANAAAEALCNRSRTAMAGRALGELIALPGELATRARDRGLNAYDVQVLAGQARLRIDLAEAPIPDQPGWSVVTLTPLGGPDRVGRGGAGSGGTLAAVGAAAILAHEIRNPLSGIRGAAQLLGEGADEEAGALTRLITREVDRIAALIDGMQRFGDARPLPLAPANIFPMLDHARDVARAGFGAGVRIIEDYDPSLPEALVDHDSFVQVMLNLLKNAIEALERTTDACITIGASFRPGVVLPAGEGQPRRSLPIEVTVADNGPGAPPAIAAHLFDPFVSGRAQGQGLGLTLVEKLVRDMGGLVQYAREGEPPLTVFRVRLQRAAA